MARVVMLMERRSAGSCSSRARVTEVLPTPEGAAMTRQKGLRGIIGLLDVLDLLAELLDGGLELDDGVGRLDVEGFRGDGVGLPGQFLRQKIE